MIYLCQLLVICKTVLADVASPTHFDTVTTPTMCICVVMLSSFLRVRSGKPFPPQLHHLKLHPYN